MAHPRARTPILFPPLFLAGLLLPVIAGAWLAIAYIGFPQRPGPIAPYVLVPLGLVAAAFAKRIAPDRWEGLWEGLHMRLAFAGLAYLVVGFKYVLAGRSISSYPAGVIAVFSAVLAISRLLVKFRARRVSRAT